MAGIQTEFRANAGWMESCKAEKAEKLRFQKLMSKTELLYVKLALNRAVFS
uniref:Uncharacterized protein n=1 Tax=Planktothrix agardhii TaxID=1160 RepID=A0A1J1JC17_PLAAG|nr:protein of unknown function [Planktothrix agardhii]